MLIGSSSSRLPFFNFGESLAQTAIAAARPAFELQFFRTQEAVLDQLDKEIENVQASFNTKSLTALLDVRIKRLQSDLANITAYKNRADAKAARLTDTRDALAELITLANPATVAEFDAKLAETIALMETTKTPVVEQYGVPDRLRAAKTDGLAQLAALAHNNFATQGDIDAVTATLTAIDTDYTASQSIVDSNVNIAFTLQESTTNTINELSRQSSNIRTEALDEATDKVKAKRDRFGQILTALSLAFEASQEIATFVAKNIAFEPEIEPGSVLNLFS